MAPETGGPVPEENWLPRLWRPRLLVLRHLSLLRLWSSRWHRLLTFLPSIPIHRSYSLLHKVTINRNRFFPLRIKLSNFLKFLLWLCTSPASHTDGSQALRVIALGGDAHLAASTDAMEHRTALLEPEAHISPFDGLVSSWS